MENRFDLLPYVLVFIRKKRVIIINFVIIASLSWLYAFLIAGKQYKAEITFFPPESESSLEGILPGGMKIPSITSSEILPEQITTIFSSKAFKRKIIDKFHLYDQYKLNKNINKFEFAIKRLNKDLFLSTEEKGSMTFSKTISLNLTAYHSKSDTTFHMANYAFFLLDSAVQAVSVNRAQRNRMFVEGQLGKNKRILDSISGAMQEFQITNKAYNIPEQVRLSISAYAQLKATLELNEIKIQALKTQFATETPELTVLRKTSETYRAKLAQMEEQEKPGVVPGLQSATRLLPQYTIYMRDMEVQNQIILLLTRELEQAKLKEEKNISSLLIVDPAYIPAYKTRPKRVMIMGLWITVYMMVILFYILVAEIYRLRLKNSTVLGSIRQAYHDR